jgi:hypothetical protein
MERAVDQPVSAIIWRIIGNDLPPIQSPTQSRNNLQFILCNEPPPPKGIERRWLLNRIVDRGEATILREMLERHGQKFVEIPFLISELRMLLPGPPSPKTVVAPGDLARTAAAASDTDPGHPFLLYATNQNGARNHALKLSADEGVDWALPLDGQLFFTAEAWAALRGVLQRASAGGKQLLKLAMLRLPKPQHTDWLHGSSSLQALLADEHLVPVFAEPQMAFRMGRLGLLGSCGLGDNVFNESLGYGKNNKREVLERLGKDRKMCLNAHLSSGGESWLVPAACLEEALDGAFALRLWYWPTKEALERVMTRVPSPKELHHGMKVRPAGRAKPSCEHPWELTEPDAAFCVTCCWTCRKPLRSESVQRLKEKLLAMELLHGGNGEP